MSEYDNMNGPELVRAYNEMANSEAGRALSTHPISKFTDLETGRRRCEALASNIRARLAGLEAADNQEATDATEEVPVEGGSIFVEFKTNTKKNRGKLLKVMSERMNQPTYVNDLVQAVYGTKTEGANVGALKMVMRGLQASIERGLPYEIVRKKDENGVSYGLYNKTERE